MADQKTLEMILAGSTLISAFALSKWLVYDLKYVRPARHLMKKEVRKATGCHLAGHATSLATQAALAAGAIYFAQKYPPLHDMYKRCLSTLNDMGSYIPYFFAGKL